MQKSQVLVTLHFLSSLSIAAPVARMFRSNRGDLRLSRWVSELATANMAKRNVEHTYSYCPYTNVEKEKKDVGYEYSYTPHEDVKIEER